MEYLRFIATIVLATTSLLGATARDRWGAIQVLDQVRNYAQNVDTLLNFPHLSYSYQKTFISTDRRNFTLFAVPTMYSIAKGKQRTYLIESYDIFDYSDWQHLHAKKLLSINTIPRERKVLKNVSKYLAPTIYNETIVDGRSQILGDVL